MARDGVVAQDQKDLLKLNHHPVCSIKEASRYFSWCGQACCWTANFSSHTSGVRFSRIYQPPVARYASLTGG